MRNLYRKSRLLLQSLQEKRNFADDQKISVDFDITEPTEIRERIITDGCCILRKAISSELMTKYKDLTNSIYDSINKRLESGEIINDFERVNIKNSQFIDQYGEENSFFNILENPKFSAILEAIFGKGNYKEAADACTRSIHKTYEIPDNTSFSPLAMHFDGIYHETAPYFAVNFWIPFSVCGKGTHAPGLFVYPTYYRDVRRFLKISNAQDLEKISAIQPDRMMPLYPLLEKLYCDKDIRPIAPLFELGDILMFNSWTPHGTYWDRKTLNCRRNLELRFQSNNWNPL